MLATEAKGAGSRGLDRRGRCRYLVAVAAAAVRTEAAAAFAAVAVAAVLARVSALALLALSGVSAELAHARAVHGPILVQITETTSKKEGQS